MTLLIALLFSFGGTLLYDLRLRQAVKNAPQLLPISPAVLPATAVIVPAYNEAENIERCLMAAIESSPANFNLWLIDDQSTDETLAIAQLLQESLQDPRLHILESQPRPAGERWVGKNWACTQAAEQTSSEYLLFIDADVRLKVEAIETVVQTAEAEQADLLTLALGIECGCLAEWLVQPLMISTLLLGFDFAAVNDPQSETAFAAGPFMLFRRSAYEQIGGHRAVADQVVEDVELSRRIKRSGHKLRYFLGGQLASVRMYRSFAALWEGWTKNLYLGSGRNLRGMIQFIVLMLLVCTLPWLALVGLLTKALFVPLNLWDWSAIALSTITVLIHYDLRCVGSKLSQIPTRYWWLTSVGGILVAAIALASIIKTETGIGWTWRGRSLAD
ncbi:glycosyltransferase [Microcoleus sp. FACHB-1515]|uniref:glycosyltransferase n=1 Tax=Cyanophyceae TaxID=3028117 RepID=UPI00168503A5|nr:glycosyltransferase family 2 protein [Microcoleus sp. FACHB-1515]MBD2090994.1 glycosyltransferase [Microcoleus sp. FACHB-1515]